MSVDPLFARLGGVNSKRKATVLPSPGVVSVWRATPKPWPVTRVLVEWYIQPEAVTKPVWALLPEDPAYVV